MNSSPTPPAAPRAEATPTAEEAESVFAGFKTIMDHAAADQFIGRRLAHADTTAHIHLVDSPQDLVMTLLLDRAPIEAIERPMGEPEIHLYIRTRDVFRFWSGEFHLAMGIARGEVKYTGPVRKLLRVVPIARRLTDTFLKLAEEQDIGMPTGRNGSGPSTPTGGTA